MTPERAPHGSGYPRTAQHLTVPASRLARRCDRPVPQTFCDACDGDTAHAAQHDPFALTLRPCGGVLWRTLGGVTLCEACDTVPTVYAD